MIIYVVMSEDTEDRRSDLLSAHRTKKGADAAKKKYDNHPVTDCAGSVCPASDFGANARVRRIGLRR